MVNPGVLARSINLLREAKDEQDNKESIHGYCITAGGANWKTQVTFPAADAVTRTCWVSPSIKDTTSAVPGLLA